MNIEEMLTEYTKLAIKKNELYRERVELKETAYKLLWMNTQPFNLNDIDGNYTGITLKTPDDVWRIPAGTVISVNGSEWVRVGDKWVSYMGDEDYDNEMFVRILRHRDQVHLIHKAY